MKLNARQCLLIAGLSMGIAASSTLAQVAPPPTQPAKEEPKYEPPVKQAAPAPSAKKETKSAEQQVGQPTITPAPSNKPSTKTQNLPTSTPYPKLIERDESGKVKRLTELPDILALRSNPTVGPKSVESIMPVLYGRRARFERIVIDNLDLYWMVTDGRMETVNLNDIKNMSQVAEMIKPLVGRTTLSQELQSRGILTRTQGGMNEYIVNEYKQAITTEIQFESDDALSEVMRFVLSDSIHETKQAYRALLAELSSQAADLVKETGLTSSGAMEIAKLQAPLDKDPEAQTNQLDTLDTALRGLDLEEAITLFTAMRNHRKNPDISPAIKRINVMHDRKVDTTGKGMEGTITYPDGREIDTRKLRDEHEKRMAVEQAEFEKQKAGKSANPDD